MAGRVWMAVLVGVTLATASPLWAAVTLAQDGQARAAIVIPDQPTETESFVATKLQWYLQKISGARLPVCRETARPAGAAVLVGATQASEPVMARLAQHRPPAEASIVAVSGDVVCSVGADSAGLLHAAYFLLEDLGCRWYFPGDWGTVIPDLPTVTVAEGETYRAPDFRIRAGLPTAGLREDTDSSWAQNEWGRGNHLGGWRWWGSGHSYSYLVPPSNFSEHPDWFAFYDGARHTTQLCTTNPQVRAKALETVRAVLAQPGAPELLCISPNDGHGFCECANCQKLIPRNPDGTLRVGDSIDRIVEFANFIADAIRDDYPDTFVTYYCDYHSVGAPTIVTPAPNTVFWIVQWAQDQFHGVSAETPMGKSLERWGKYGNPLFVYTYYGSYGSWTLWPQVHAIRNDIPYYRGKGVIGLYSETHAHWGAQHLNFIVFPRLLWDADTDVNALIADFCTRFYGPAAPFMREFYQILEETAQAGPAQSHLSSEIIRAFEPGVLARLRDRIYQAQQAVSGLGEPYATRMDFVANGFLQADMYLTANHLKAQYARTTDPALRQLLRTQIAQNLRDALAIVQDRRHRDRLTENWLSEANLKAELTTVEQGTGFAPGPFGYTDGFERGGKTVLDAVSRTGFADGAWGLDLAGGASGELIYEFRATDAAFESARITWLLVYCPTEVAVAQTAEGPWTVVVEGDPAQVAGPLDLGTHVSGKRSFLLRFRVTNPSQDSCCAIDQLNMEGTVRTS